MFGLNTQSDNALPANNLTVLGTDASGDFTANFNGAAALPSWIDSGADAYDFDDPGITTCPGPAFVGYYCPSIAPLPLSAVNTGVGAYNASSTVQFAVANPSSFVAGAAAYSGSRGRWRIEHLHLGYAVLLRPEDLHRDRATHGQRLHWPVLRLLKPRLPPPPAAAAVAHPAGRLQVLVASSFANAVKPRPAATSAAEIWAPLRSARLAPASSNAWQIAA